MKVKVKSIELNIPSFRELNILEKAIAILCSVLILIILSFCFSGNKSHAAESVELSKTYNSIMIEEGDTLTDIAREFYTPEYYGSLQDAIKEVKELNNLHNDHITAGCYLIIPVLVD